MSKDVFRAFRVYAAVKALKVAPTEEQQRAFEQAVIALGKLSAITLAESLTALRSSGLDPFQMPNDLQSRRFSLEGSQRFMKGAPSRGRDFSRGSDREFAGMIYGKG